MILVENPSTRSFVAVQDRPTRVHHRQIGKAQRVLATRHPHGAQHAQHLLEEVPLKQQPPPRRRVRPLRAPMPSKTPQPEQRVLGQMILTVSR